MSSLKNSLHRKSHKERSQLSHRTRLGLLEKHKDYVLRARDYHSKQDRINLLREKAATRNKDEFYFSMTKEKTEGGVHVKDRGAQALPTDIVKVLKTQDENYLRTMRAAGLKKIDKLKSQLTQLADLLKPGILNGEDDGDELDEQELEALREAGVIAPQSKRARRKSHSSKGKHVLFAEDAAEAQQYVASSRKSSDTQEDVKMDVSAESTVDLGWKAPAEAKRKRRKSKADTDAEDTTIDQSSIQTAEQAKELSINLTQEHRTRLLKELSARLVRDRHLRYAEREMEMQRALMGKGGSKKLSGVEKITQDGDSDDEDEDRGPKKVDEQTWKPRVYKWRIERKR
ncbi:U3 small nucleolar RNA-associated protein 11 [Trametes pubescens]|uniref:U3 small nucleolar RNA-associated protein 11 n=1 Tax=Trametes pubescens TaxID=154538 RepID=A0A1M2VWR2_TRAPU|nr:U3 small nucleolar RNA-associated protein 11 [Trametes pubescens]